MIQLNPQKLLGINHLKIIPEWFSQRCVGTQEVISASQTMLLWSGMSFLLNSVCIVLYCKGPSFLAARERWGQQAACTGVTAQHPVRGNMGLAPSMCFDLSGISISVQRLGGVTEEWRTGC